jgi:type IV pilus assembly protein PilM
MISWKLKTRGVRPIGLDIGHNFIKMIQLAINGGHISVVAADKTRIDPGINGDGEERKNFIISAIKQMLAGGNFRGRDVVSCLPNGRLKITSFRLAEAETGEMEQVLRKEVSNRFGLDPEKDTINYLIAGNVQQGDEIKTELILFAADNETIKSHIDMLEQAKLRPVAIDTVPCALFRSFERLLRRREDKEQTVVFVDVGSQFTTVVFGCGGEISFVKQIPIGGEKINQEIASQLGVGIIEAETLRDALRKERRTGSEKGLLLSESDLLEQGGEVFVPHRSGDGISLDTSTRQTMVDAIGAVAEELAREISLCFRYYTVTFRGKRVERAVFAGGEAYENTLLNVLRRQLAVEIEVAQPVRGFDMTNVKFEGCKRGSLCEWAVAVGLSLKGLKAVLGLEEEGEVVQENMEERREHNYYE